MQKEMSSRIVTALTFMILVSVTVFAQQDANRCGHVEYVNKNQVNPSPLYVNLVSGHIISEVDEAGGTTREIGPVTEACLGIFTEKHHRLIASLSVGVDGRFMFGSVPAGRYRLIVRADPLCPANVSVVVAHDKKRRKKNRQLVIHMRASGYDTCSYGDYK